MQEERKAPALGEEPLEDGDAATSPVTRVGTVVGAGVVAALLASLPAELRVGSGGSVGRALQQWLALSALLLPVAVLLVAVFRRARVGLRLIAGDRAPLVFAATLWWAILELAVLAVFGAVLRAKTHHHGLAGVTFAVAALASGVVLALLTVRGASMVARLPPSAHRVALVVAAASAVLAVVLIGFRTSRAEGMHTAAALLDTIVLVAAAAVGSTRAATRSKPFALVGVPLAVAIALFGVATVRAQANLSELLAAAAPLQVWILRLFGR